MRSPLRLDLKPHHQIVIISIAALMALATVAGAMLTRLGEIDATYAQVAGRSVPITDALTTAQLLFQADMAEARELLGPMTETQRYAAITDLTEKTRLADAAWQAYKRLAGHSAIEKKLQGVAERAEGEQIRLISPALSGNGVDENAAARIAESGATQIGAIETLRNRYATERGDALAALNDGIDRAQRAVLLIGTAVLAFLLLAFGAVFVSVRRRDRQERARELDRAVDAERNHLETRLTRSLDMVHTEEAAYPRIRRALAEVATSRSSEVLVADSSFGRIRQVVALGAATEGSGCPVGAPRDCPAIARGQTQVFAHSGALDACPYLDDRPAGACSAACIPLSIGAKTVGIVHVTSAPDTPPDPETVARLEIVARKAGDRIGMLRAFSRSETEAHTDQLTGLLNRRSLEEEVHLIAETGRPYAVAYGDLDHFKQLNDVYGHDAGDRALRVFSRVLRDSVRPNDIPARYGGEEFVVVLPECSIADATQVLERVRENLARAQVSAASPACTVSFGLAPSGLGTDFHDVLKNADQALAVAKEQGRDRIVVRSASQESLSDV